MKMAQGNGFGRPFVKAPVVVFGVSSFAGLQSGNWVRVAGSKRAARFVRERETGNMYVVTAPKGARMSNAAFRLAVGNETGKVVKSVK